jgi:hypothetical protein
MISAFNAPSRWAPFDDAFVEPRVVELARQVAAVEAVDQLAVDAGF